MAADGLPGCAPNYRLEVTSASRTRQGYALRRDRGPGRGCLSRSRGWVRPTWS
ncbi:MAG: hypothetical protein WKG07_12125 [Hymenobacter sp.]